jgi:hypothetical protein
VIARARPSRNWSGVPPSLKKRPLISSINAPVLDRLGRVGDLHQLARGGVGVSDALRFDEFHGYGGTIIIIIAYHDSRHESVATSYFGHASRVKGMVRPGACLRRSRVGGRRNSTVGSSGVLPAIRGEGG